MKLFKNKIVTKKYALKAALHRRLAKKMINGKSNLMTFTESDLIEFFNYESKGIKPCTFDELKARNGYAFGKWLRDIDVVQMSEDVVKGDFAKIEYLSTPIEKLHNKEFLANIVSSAWFPFEKHNYRLTQQLGALCVS